MTKLLHKLDKLKTKLDFPSFLYIAFLSHKVQNKNCEIIHKHHE